MNYFTTFLWCCFAAVLSAAEPVVLFNGKDIANWQIKAEKGLGTNRWVVGEPRLAAKRSLLEVTGPEGAMVNQALHQLDGWDIYSKAEFGSCVIELDAMITLGASSGIFIMGEYEVQVADSFGKDHPGVRDMGAIYDEKAPPVNAAKKAGEWQHFRIEWQAPAFDANGKKTANAKFVKIELNGTLLHADVEMADPTPGGVTGKEAATGPLMFQGTQGAVAYRNITVTPR